MWFDKKEKPVPEATSQKPHRTPEERIRDNEDVQTFDDLEILGIEDLLRVAIQCDIEPADPDACVSCQAFILWEQRTEGAKQTLAGLPVSSSPLPGEVSAVEEEEVEVPPGAGELTDTEISQLPILPPDPTDEQLRDFEEELEPTDLRQQFIDQVHALDLAVRQLMEGPPIPPPNVSMDDMALLTIAAREWIHSTQTLIDQGFGLAPEKQKIRDMVSRLLERMGA